MEHLDGMDVQLKLRAKKARKVAQLTLQKRE